jgi:hypothetical protein
MSKELGGLLGLPLIELPLLPGQANYVIAGASFQQLLATTEAAVTCKHPSLDLDEEHGELVQEVIWDYKERLLDSSVYFLELSQGAVVALGGLEASLNEGPRSQVESDSIGGGASGVTEGSRQDWGANNHSLRSSTEGKSSSINNTMNVLGECATGSSKSEGTSSISSGPSSSARCEGCDHPVSSSGSNFEESSDGNRGGIRRSSQGEKAGSSSGGVSCSSGKSSSAGRRDSMSGVADCSSATSISSPIASERDKFRAVPSAGVMALCINAGVLTFNTKKTSILAALRLPRLSEAARVTAGMTRQFHEAAQLARWTYSLPWFTALLPLLYLSPEAEVQQFAVGTAPVLLRVLIHLVKERPEGESTACLVRQVLQTSKGKCLKRALSE